MVYIYFVSANINKTMCVYTNVYFIHMHACVCVCVHMCIPVCVQFYPLHLPSSLLNENAERLVKPWFNGLVQRDSLGMGIPISLKPPLL